MATLAPVATRPPLRIDSVEESKTGPAHSDVQLPPGGNPRHTEYADLGHTVFAWAYTEPALVEWLFAQNR